MASSGELSAIISEMAASIQGSPHARRLMRLFCRDIGPRPAGSENMRRAVRLLAQEWRRLGAAGVHTEKVGFPGWREAPAALEVLSPTARRIESLQAVHSGSGEAIGPLADASAGGAEDVSRLGKGLRGAVVLLPGWSNKMRGGPMGLVSERIFRAQKAGASGAILAGSDPTRPYVEFLHPAGGISIPALTVSGRDGKRLSGLCRGTGVRVHLRTRGKSRSATCTNLVGEIVPDGGADETVVISAHLDTVHAATGAMDDLSGVVALTEIARALVKHKEHFARRLRMIAFTAEEVGLEGSQSYVREHQEELDHLRFVLNLDGLLKTTAEGVAVIGAPEMTEWIRRALRGHRPAVDVRDKFCSSSDYFPFVLRGIPAARPADWKDLFPAWFHTTADTEDKVKTSTLRLNATMCGRILLKLLAADSLPARRKRRDEICDILCREHVAETLRWRGFRLPSCRRPSRRLGKKGGEALQ